MFIPGFNTLDRQVLLLAPRDYASDPARFGTGDDLTFGEPDGGNAISKRAAKMQHRMVLEWQRRFPRHGERLARRVGCSRNTISRTLRGERWAGQAVIGEIAADLRRSPVPGDLHRPDEEG